MSVSQHPVALRLEQQVGDATRLLATVMALPLVDGIFPALVIAGALSSPLGIVETGLLIFGGSATVAVILAEMDGSRREQVTSILLLGALLIPIAGLEAVFAETLKTVLNFEVFHRFAGLVILAIAAKTASAKIGEYLPSPSVVIGLGLIASVDLTGATLVVSPDVAVIARAVAAAGTGVAFALAVALLAPQLRGAVDLDLFRFGSSVALGMLAIDVLGLLPTEAPVALGVLAVTALFAYDPGAELDAVDDAAADADSDPDGVSESEDAPDAPDAPSAPSAAVADGGDWDDLSGDEADEAGDIGYGYPDDERSRAPWL
ncbi:MAG: DUF5794 domain-containing protein [Haloquadratum sp.]